MIRPSPLRKGDLIGIAAPASSFDPLEFQKGVQTLELLGFRLHFREDIFSKERYLAGSDERRAEELNELFGNPKIKAIFFARGGYGTQRIIPLLNPDLISKNPKIVMGYSDITTLLIYLYQRFSWVTFHGPVVAKAMGDSFQERGQRSLVRTLMNPDRLGEIKPEGMIYLQEGKARGVLVGGCLSLILSSLKTSYELAFSDKILFFEDVNEPLYKIDRMFTQLRMSGKLLRVRGIVFGPFSGSGEKNLEVQELLLEVLKGLEVPIIFGFPSGHLEDMMTIPLGVEVELDSKKGSINFLEGGVVL